MRLEQRDLVVLADLFLSRVLQRADLLSLGYFTSIPRCNARLLALRQSGFIDQMLSISGIELRAPLYFCRSKGVKVAAEHLCIASADAMKVHRAGIRDSAIRHAMSCTAIRARLARELNVSQGLEMSKWFQEPLCQHEFISQSGRSVTIKPDGLALIRSCGVEHHLFVESDLGNANSAKVHEKLKSYGLYHSSGAFSEAYGSTCFSVLIVTTDERRLRHLASLDDSPRLIYTTWKRLAGASLASAIVFDRGNSSMTLREALL